MPEGLRLSAPKQLEIIEYPLPERLKGDEILLKVKTGGICGSDIHIYDGSHPIGDYPKIIGHEFAGIVEEVGPEVSRLSPGDKVVVNPIISCGSCYACKVLNRPNICSSLQVRGVHLDGGFCTHMILPAAAAHKFQNISWNAATLVEPFTIGSQIIDRCRLSSGDTILINGVGTIGLSVLMLAKMMGVRIIASDLHGSHLDRAVSLGADFTVNPGETSMVEAVREFTEGNGVSVVVESVGTSETFQSALGCAAPGARITLIGFDKKALKVSPFDITFNEWELIGSRLNTYKFEPVIELFESGRIQPVKLISHVFPYQKAAEVFPFILENPDEVLKVILEFNS